MITARIKELALARESLAALEADVKAALAAELSSLPAKYGFPDAASFIAAVRSAAGSKPGKRAKTPAAGPAPKTRGRKKRAKVTDETRSAVKRLVESGKTGGEIATELSISLPTVQNIKKALGLVRAK